MLHAGSIPETDLATWDFFVEGEVENPIRLSWDELNALPRTAHTQDIHCVTRWSRFDVTFEGVHWSALEELVQPKPSAHFVVAHAEEGYTANVPISFLRDPLSLLATHADGAPLDAGARRPAATGDSRASTSGRARSGCAGSSSPPTTAPGSGSATATTTTPIRSRRSDTASSEAEIPPKWGRRNEPHRRKPGYPILPVLPPLSGRPSGHSSFQGRTSLRTTRRAGIAGPSSFVGSGSEAYAATAGRSLGDALLAVRRRRRRLDRIAEVVARVPERLVHVRLDVRDRVALPEARHERPVVAREELQHARVRRSTFACASGAHLGRAPQEDPRAVCWTTMNITCTSFRHV